MKASTYLQRSDKGHRGPGAIGGPGPVGGHEPDLTPAFDPPGSLVDADMGAYYTWLNQQRLSGGDKATFLVWFEDQQEAVAIGPKFDRDKRSNTPIDLRDLIAQIT